MIGVSLSEPQTSMIALAKVCVCLLAATYHFKMSVFKYEDRAHVLGVSSGKA